VLDKRHIFAIRVGLLACRYVNSTRCKKSCLKWSTGRPNCFIERCHDQPPKCHFQHHTNRHLRETNAGQDAAERKNPHCSRSLAIKSHLRLGSSRPSQHVPRRWSNYSPKVRASVLSPGNSNIQDPNLVSGATNHNSDGQESFSLLQI
jgi:hypothetical protein